MAKIMIFIDGSWLYSSQRYLADLRDSNFNIDYGKLPKVLARYIGLELGGASVDTVRTYLFGSNAKNYLEPDKDMVTKRRMFYDILREEYNYEVEVYPIDYRKRRLRKKDRDPMDDFAPTEKCVDIALASSMLYYAALPMAYDIAVLVGGDRDYIPMLQKVRRLGKRVAIASMQNSCAFELRDSKNAAGVRDFDIIWMEDLMDDIELTSQLRKVECESPLHDGDRIVETEEFIRKNRPYFCKDCREKLRTQRQNYYEEAYETEQPNYNTADHNQYLDNEEELHRINSGDTCRGIIKRKMDWCAFIETSHGDYYFGIDDCAVGTNFDLLTHGTPVEFIVGRKPNPQLRGGQGNGNAEDISLLEEAY